MEKRYTKYKKGKTYCKQCGLEFEKAITEINRNERLNRPNFCSRSCVGKNNSKNFGDRRANYEKSKLNEKKVNKYAKFKYHFRTINSRDKNVDLTIDDLIEQWTKQNGVCPFTGIELILSSYTKIEKSQIYSASVDRIDSSIGYTKSNIRWISRAINYMKNSMTDDEVWVLCDIITSNINKKTRV